MAEAREAMLRLEFREWYPHIRADWWYPARRLADLVLEQRRSFEPHWELESRVPSDQHFLFRGGRARGGSQLRTRDSDQPRESTLPDQPGPREP